jgi:hypothetical protein
MLENKAIKIYLEHGCLGVELYRDAKDPRRWMEIDRYRDREHYNDVTILVDEDPRMSPLLEDFKSLFSGDDNKPEKKIYNRMI